MRTVSVAIDGPSGAGKSTLARMTACKIGFIYVDTGAIYRSVALFFLRKCVDSKDKDSIVSSLKDINIEIKYDGDGVQRMYLCGDDVTDSIRVPEVSIFTSNISAIPEVRTFLLEMQRDMARKYNVIMDGRDIGTVVLPDADIKIFLTATAEDRAQRRFKDLAKKDISVTYESVLNDIIYRDQNDSSRDVSPLRPADDAIIVDTTGNTLERSFEIISSLVEERLKNGSGI